MLEETPIAIEWIVTGLIVTVIFLAGYGQDLYRKWKKRNDYYKGGDI